MRRFQGWEPKRRTTVTERDEDGRPAQWVTEVEAEFDVNERDSWYALDEWESEVCGQCGQLRSVCSDPETPWYPQRATCWSTATRTVVERRWHEKHENAKPDVAGYLPTDGVTVWVSPHDLTPDDDFV